MHIVKELCNSMLHNTTLISEWGERVWMCGSALKNLGGGHNLFPEILTYSFELPFAKGVKLYLHRESHLTSRTFTPRNQETHVQEHILHNTTVTLKSNRTPQSLKCPKWLQWQSFADRHVAQYDTIFGMRWMCLNMWSRKNYLFVWAAIHGRVRPHLHHELHLISINFSTHISRDPHPRTHPSPHHHDAQKQHNSTIPQMPIPPRIRQHPNFHYNLLHIGRQT